MQVMIEALSFGFGQQKIFDNFSFALPKGRFVSLLGGSGVGKSTLLRIIAGLENQYTGDVRFAKETTLAYMAQHDALYPWLSVLDNVQLHAHLTAKKSAQTQRQALALLDSVNLSCHVHKYPYELSGGQRQRVALARTLMSEANLVLMDEPFSALDAVTRHELQALAHQLLKGKTVLLITHDPQEAIRLSNDIHVLKGQPAVISSTISPSGEPIRSLSDSAFGALQARLLAELGEGSV